MHPEKFQLDQNGRLSTIIYFNMPDIWQAMPDARSLNYKTKCRFQGGICSEKFQINYIQNGQLRAIFNIFICTWQTVVYRARLISVKKM